MSDFVEVAWHGIREWEDAIAKVERKAQEATLVALKAAGESVVQAARRQFTGGGDRPGRGTGRLQQDIGTEGPTPMGPLWNMKIGPKSLPYARIIELGKHGEHWRKPHPYLEPGYREAVATFGTIFRKTWGGVM